MSDLSDETEPLIFRVPAKQKIIKVCSYVDQQFWVFKRVGLAAIAAPGYLPFRIPTRVFLDNGTVTWGISENLKIFDEQKLSACLNYLPSVFPAALINRSSEAKVVRNLETERLSSQFFDMIALIPEDSDRIYRVVITHEMPVKFFIWPNAQFRQMTIIGVLSGESGISECRESVAISQLQLICAELVRILKSGGKFLWDNLIADFSRNTDGMWSLVQVTDTKVRKNPEYKPRPNVVQRSISTCENKNCQAFDCSYLIPSTLDRNKIKVCNGCYKRFLLQRQIPGPKKIGRLANELTYQDKKFISFVSRAFSLEPAHLFQRLGRLLKAREAAEVLDSVAYCDRFDFLHAQLVYNEQIEIMHAELLTHTGPLDPRVLLLTGSKQPSQANPIETTSAFQSMLKLHIPKAPEQSELSEIVGESEPWFPRRRKVTTSKSGENQKVLRNGKLERYLKMQGKDIPQGKMMLLKLIKSEMKSQIFGPGSRGYSVLVDVLYRVRSNSLSENTIESVIAEAVALLPADQRGFLSDQETQSRIAALLRKLPNERLLQNELKPEFATPRVWDSSRKTRFFRTLAVRRNDN